MYYFKFKKLKQYIFTTSSFPLGQKFSIKVIIPESKVSQILLSLLSLVYPYSFVKLFS